jgi:peptide/nickel transport system permease protein
VSLGLTVRVALLAARRPNGIVDRLSMMVSMVGLSVANYVLALVLVYVVAVKLDWLPAIGYVNRADGIWPFIKSLMLPAVSIGFPLFCFYTRVLRADILEQMQGEDYWRRATRSHATSR